jgi:6-phospho-3-hexuloisomerase
MTIMSFVKEVSKWILDGINSIIQVVNEEQINQMIEIIMASKHKKILVIGSGRSGFVGRAFALRLMQSGFNAYVGGETITPSLTNGDLVIAISGSGNTTTVVAQVEVSKEIGAGIIAITSHPGSKVGKLADFIVEIKGRTKEETEIDFVRRQITGDYNRAPMGTMFELSALIFFDSVIAEIMERSGQTEIDLRRRHANTE